MTTNKNNLTRGFMTALQTSRSNYATLCLSVIYHCVCMNHAVDLILNSKRCMSYSVYLDVRVGLALRFLLSCFPALSRDSGRFSCLAYDDGSELQQAEQTQRPRRIPNHQTAVTTFEYFSFISVNRPTLPSLLLCLYILLSCSVTWDGICAPRSRASSNARTPL